MRLVSVFIASLLMAVSLHAQSSTSLSGTVSDPTGAVIAGAKLAVTNIATGVSQTTEADSSGRYNYPQLQPGNYKLVSTHPGFADTVVQNIELQVSTATTINVTFEKVGATSTVVSVEAEAGQVNTQDATLGNAINTF